MAIFNIGQSACNLFCIKYANFMQIRQFLHAVWSFWAHHWIRHVFFFQDTKFYQFLITNDDDKKKKLAYFCSKLNFNERCHKILVVLSQKCSKNGQNLRSLITHNSLIICPILKNQSVLWSAFWDLYRKHNNSSRI